MKLFIDKNTVHFLELNDSLRNSRFRIPIFELADLEENGTHMSFWISELALEDWVPTACLYQLARHIQERYPNNRIDWSATMLWAEQVRLHRMLRQGILAKAWSKGHYSFITKHLKHTAFLQAVEDAKSDKWQEYIRRKVAKNAKHHKVKL